MNKMTVGSSLQFCLLFVLLGHGGAIESSSGCSSGFPAGNRLVYSVTVVPSSQVATRLIPEMNFMCNGTITGFTFAGRMSLNGSGPQNPVFQVWREESDGYYRIGAVAIAEASCDGGFKRVFNGSGVFHCELNETAQLSVQPGDILGLELAPDSNSAIDLSLARIIKGPTNYVFTEQQFNSSSKIVLSARDSVNQDLPQITVTVSEGDCTMGFPNIPAFREKTIARQFSTVTVLIPDMNFTCNHRIISFTVTAINWQDGDQDPTIQIWRRNYCSDPGNYYKIERPIPINLGSIVCADGLPTITTRRTYFCILNRDYQIGVQPGDILGLEIPPENAVDFDVLFTQGGPSNYIFNSQLNSTVDLNQRNTVEQQLPQISLGFTSDQCTSGFPDVVSRSGSFQGSENRVSTRLFPDLQFGCSGKIVRFTVAVVDRNGQQRPKLQIWRPISDTESNVYYKPGPDTSIFERSPMCLRGRLNGGIFRCTLNETYQNLMSVQPGDILGLELPPEDDTDFDIYFTEQGPENYVFEESLASSVNLSEANIVTLHMPQINFMVMLDSGLSSESSTSTCDYTPASTTLNTKKGIVSAIVGSVIGSSIALLLLCVVSVLLVMWIGRRRRTKLNKSHDNDLDPTVNLVNTVYVPGGTSRNEFPAVSYIHTTQQIPTEDNVAYDQAKPQIWTEDNVAYGQSTPQISTEQNVAYSEATLQITTGDNVAYHGHKGGTYATISNPPEYDYVPL